MEGQLRKAFEEVTTRKIEMIREFSKETRKLVKEQEEKIMRLQNIVLSREEHINQLQIQIANLLQEKYKNGS